jgi:hypothetical protein
MSDCPRFRFGTTVNPDRGVHLHHVDRIEVGRIEDWSAWRVQRQRSCARCQVVAVRLSRTEDYLVDNIYAHILS